MDFKKILETIQEVKGASLSGHDLRNDMGYSEHINEIVEKQIEHYKSELDKLIYLCSKRQLSEKESADKIIKFYMTMPPEVREAILDESSERIIDAIEAKRRKYIQYF